MKTENASSETILCISTHCQGDALLRELARLGCRVVLLTVDELRDAEWPRESLADFQTMPGGMTQQQIANTVTYLARTRRLARILSMGASDMVTAAALREHMRIPGMGITTTRYFHDRLAMRARAAQLGIRVPAFAAVLNYDELRAYMEDVPAPWLLRPRCVVSTAAAQTLHEAEEVWRALEELGDRQSDFLLEQAIAGDIFRVDGIVAEGKVVFAAVHRDGEMPAADRPLKEDRELKSIHAELVPGLGLLRGAAHTEFLRSHASGKLYFLETMAQPGDPATIEAMEQAHGINSWIEWARVEVAALRGEAYRLPAGARA